MVASPDDGFAGCNLQEAIGDGPVSVQWNPVGLAGGASKEKGQAKLAVARNAQTGEVRTLRQLQLEGRRAANELLALHQEEPTLLVARDADFGSGGLGVQTHLRLPFQLDTKTPRVVLGGQVDVEPRRLLVTLVLGALRLSSAVNQGILLTLGLTSCLYAILDIKSDVLDRPELQSDAAMLGDLTGIDTVVWGGLWITVAVLASAWLFQWSYRRA